MHGSDLVDRLQLYLHRIPHINFKFRRLSDDESFFDVSLRGDYAKSIFLILCTSLLIALIFLITTIIIWITQCCKARRSEPIRSSRKHIRRLSTTLFFISVICFILLAICLFGNEHLNKNVLSTITSLSYVNANFRRSLFQANKMNQTQLMATTHVDDLSILIEKMSHEVPKINDTMLREADTLLTQISDRIDDVKIQLKKLSNILIDLPFLEYSHDFGERLEYERWLCSLFILVIVISVLFAGVIAFCRQSKKGAIIFSGLGIIVFVVSWLMFSIVFPLTIAYADFCVDGRDFLRSRLSADFIDSFNFYTTCESHENHDLSPSNLPIIQINAYYREIKNADDKLEALLFTLFNRSSDIENTTLALSNDLASSFKSIGALESILSCYNMHQNVQSIRTSFCRNGFAGVLIVDAALLLLCITLFVLLILVSKSWHIFARSTSDYLEVGDDDNYSPRDHDTMPDNIYDTNIFNPRARQHLSNQDANTRLIDGFSNGGMPPPPPFNAHNSEVEPISLDLTLNTAAARVGERCSWQQQMMAHNSALANAPPPPQLMGMLHGSTVSTLNRNGTMLRNSGANNYQQLNSTTNAGVYGRYDGRQLNEFHEI